LNPAASGKKEEDDKKNNWFLMRRFDLRYIGSKSPDLLVNAGTKGAKTLGDALVRLGDRLERGITRLAMGIVLASSLGVLAARWTEVGNLWATCRKAKKIVLAIILFVACRRGAVAILKSLIDDLKLVWSSWSSLWWHKGN
jgi:hypothetical protein